MPNFNWCINGNDFLREKNGKDFTVIEHRYQKMSFRITGKEIDKLRI